MHRRKKYLIYPPYYQPGDSVEVRHSKRQALKAAVRMGDGASVDVSVYIHPARGKFWASSQLLSLWEPLAASNVAQRSGV